MTQIDNLSNFANQVSLLQLTDGTIVSMGLLYCAAAERWTMNITYNGKSYNGIALCTLPNILRQWKDILPFGIACATADQTDPFDVNDFYTGRVALYLLTKADVNYVERVIIGGAAA